eukprot:c20411_g1_i1 orf=113-2767(-)
MSYRDRSPRPKGKVPLMYSPRVDGAGVLTSRAVPLSPLSKGLDGPPGSGSLPAVDYDDVFGGPPRFATTMLASQSAPSAALDRAIARTPSFRSPSLPVFELPVFGDDVFGSGSSTYEPRTASVAYEDIFREEVHTPDVFLGSYGSIPHSKPSSRSSSRRMSPIHPAASIPGQLEQDEILAAANSAACFKGRPGAGKLSSRCSFSSFSSFDESRGKPLDSPSTVLRNEMVASSLPSSPPHAGVTWGHVKRFTGSNITNSFGASTNVEVDDVFGGFPQRTYSQAFSAVPHDVNDASNASRTHSAGVPSKRFVAGNKAQSTTQAFEPYVALNRTLSSSSSSNGDQELHDDFIEIRMDRQSDSSVSKKVALTAGKAWVTVSDLNRSTQPTPRRMPTRPPPAPAAQLKFKSWKDWTSDVPLSQPVCPPLPGSVPDATAAAIKAPGVKTGLNGGDTISQFDKGLAESGPSKQLDFEKYLGSLPPKSEAKAKPAERSLEMEERELQALLTNAWKINEKREKKKTSTSRQPQEPPTVVESKVQEPRVKEGKGHSNKQSKASQPQQSTPTLEDAEVDLHWKAWRKYPSKARKESTKNGFAPDNTATKVPISSAQDLVQERVGRRAKLHAMFEAEDSFDPEEIVKVVTEEMSTNCSAVSTEGSDRWAEVGINIKPGQRGMEDAEVFGKEQLSKNSKDENGTASVLSSASNSVQDFVQFSEQLEVSLSEGGEDIDCFTGLDPSLEGFQDIEGESLERRKSRWVRHLRAKERMAKALEEMQQRDAEVQRQHEEKQQLAEVADRQIKRWAAGKEGNLRALLSNLQHVLWKESGWQPISLTDLIEGPDVKKAYRKATLFVHPDKVQQKGATVQQKYIAERVFDILQEAWKTFNMQELF